jgi:hypothetical protein
VPFLFLDGDEDGFWTSNEPNGYAVSAIWPWPVAHTTLPGATHAGFNECWNYGRHGDNPMMSREAQLRITSTLVQRFLTMVFDAYDGPTPSADLTRGFATQFGGALSPLGLNSYRPRYLWRAGSRHSIEDFQSSPDHENEHGLANTGTGSLTFNEGSPLDFEYTAPDNRVVRLSWTDAATYRLGLDPSTPGFSPAETDLLTFDALVALDSVNPEFLAQEFVVELRDSDNDVARVAVGAVNELDPAMGSHSHRTTRFETLSIPLSAFRAVNPSLALSSINRLAFRFAAGTQGVIYLDNIAFTSQ